MSKNEGIEASQVESGTPDKLTDSQYVTFNLSGQTYGVSVDSALEVIRLVAMAEPPQSPSYVVGLINIRGSVVPIIDMRKRLSLEPIDYTLTTPILVVTIDNLKVGLIIDQVAEVVTISSGKIEQAKESFSHAQCFTGVAKLGSKLVFMLNLDQLFTSEDASLIQEILDTPVAEKVLA